MAIIEIFQSPAPKDPKDPPARWSWILLSDAESRGVLAGSGMSGETEAEARENWREFVEAVNGAKGVEPVTPAPPEPGLFDAT